MMEVGSEMAIAHLLGIEVDCYLVYTRTDVL